MLKPYAVLVNGEKTKVFVDSVAAKAYMHNKAFKLMSMGHKIHGTVSPYRVVLIKDSVETVMEIVS